MAHERIEINPQVMAGKPVIRGTRITVELILRKLGAGMNSEAILRDHPRLMPEDIRAAQNFRGVRGRMGFALLSPSYGTGLVRRMD